VVIPVRDGAATIEAAVRSALSQESGGPLEVVVADGGSEDGTVEILERLAADNDVTIVPNPAGSTPAGLNAAIRATRGDVIVRCDAHAELPPGYVAAAVVRLESTGAGVVGGIQDAVGTTPFQRAVAYAMSSLLGAGGATYRSSRPPGPTDTVYLGVFPRQVLAEVGLYDESLLRNQDYELNHRIRRSGRQVFFAPELRVTYRPRSSVQGLWRQYFDYGKWKRRVVRRHPGSLRARQTAAPALVVGLVASGAVATVSPLLGGLLPAAYGAAVVVSTVRAVRRHGDSAAWLMAIVYPVMHLAWGSGFLVGRTADRGPQIPSSDVLN
jgi:glycosyltransferase involved in cell wall biosynthesis